MAKISPYAFFQAFDNNGAPLAGGKLYTYEAGTSTDKVTYTSEDETAANTNPIILDSAGRADIWLESGSYKFVLDDANDVLVDDTDDITGGTTDVYGSSVIDLTSNTAITTASSNTVFDCVGTFTLSLLDVATAEEGFIFVVRNSGSGVITIDPDGSETIDGGATKDIEAGGSLNVNCTGTAWITTNENFGDFIKDDSAKVKVSSNDTTAADLETKILSSGLAGLSTQNDGANETRTIDVPIASQAQAEAGTDNATAMTPLRTSEAIAELAGGWVYGSIVATTSGTSVTLTTAIPSNAVEIQTMLFGVGHDSADETILLQFGDAGGVETTGYNAGVAGNLGVTASSSGFPLVDDGADATNTLHGFVTLALYDSATFNWVVSGNVNREQSGTCIDVGSVSGNKATSAALSSLTLTSAATFDAGSARIRYRTS